MCKPRMAKLGQGDTLEYTTLNIAAENTAAELIFNVHKYDLNVILTVGEVNS